MWPRLPPKESGVFWSERGFKQQNMSATAHPVVSEKEFYSVSEVAAKFGISQKSVYRLLDRGLLKASSALRKKMIPKASIVQFIATSFNGGLR